MTDIDARAHFVSYLEKCAASYMWPDHDTEQAIDRYQEIRGIVNAIAERFTVDLLFVYEPRFQITGYVLNLLRCVECDSPVIDPVYDESQTFWLKRKEDREVWCSQDCHDNTAERRATVE